MKYPALLALALAACSDAKTDADYRADVTAAMHDQIGGELVDLIDAATALEAAAPTHAWNATADATAIAAMTDAWRRARVAYEHVEGATAPIFPDLDFTLDARYDNFLAGLPHGDADLFDGDGVTGMHAIERVLYAPTIRDEVTDFEQTLPGYVPAAWPATDAEAMAFKTGLAARLVTDAQTLHDQWSPSAIDIGATYVGLVGLMNEQKEKVNLAATGEEESRYANVTLFDLRNNLAGTRAVYGLFRPWIATKARGADADAAVVAQLDALDALYTTTAGDGIPAVPDDWSSDAPTAANLATPFGMLWQRVHAAVDPTASGSIVFEMNAIADLLGFGEFVEGA